MPKMTKIQLLGLHAGGGPETRLPIGVAAGLVHWLHTWLCPMWPLQSFIFQLSPPTWALIFCYTYVIPHYFEQMFLKIYKFYLKRIGKFKHKSYVWKCCNHCSFLVTMNGR